MVKKSQESWNQPETNILLRVLATIDFSLEVILSIGVVILLSFVLFIVARDRFQTFNYLVDLIHSL